MNGEEGKEQGDYRKKSASNDSHRNVNIQDKETNAQSSSQSDTHAAAMAGLDKHCNGSSSKRPQQDTEEKDQELQTEASHKRIDIESVLRKEFPSIRKSAYVAKHS